jgi:hypothetical protein
MSQVATKCRNAAILMSKDTAHHTIGKIRKFEAQIALAIEYRAEAHGDGYKVYRRGVTERFRIVNHNTGSCDCLVGNILA